MFSQSTIASSSASPGSLAKDAQPRRSASAASFCTPRTRTSSNRSFLILSQPGMKWVMVADQSPQLLLVLLCAQVPFDQQLNRSPGLGKHPTTHHEQSPTHISGTPRDPAGSCFAPMPDRQSSATRWPQVVRELLLIQPTPFFRV